jgi:hypothetical protein
VKLFRALVIALALAACGNPPVAQTPKHENAVIVLKSNVRDAQLYVDGRFIGPLDAIGGGVAVAAGTHRFELRHEDYFSSYLELTVAKAERKRLQVDLAPILP